MSCHRVCMFRNLLRPDGCGSARGTIEGPAVVLSTIPDCLDGSRPLLPHREAQRLYPIRSQWEICKGIGTWSDRGGRRDFPGSVSHVENAIIANITTVPRCLDWFHRHTKTGK